jgi:hypothetical protein
MHACVDQLSKTKGMTAVENYESKQIECMQLSKTKGMTAVEKYEANQQNRT